MRTTIIGILLLQSIVAWSQSPAWESWLAIKHPSGFSDTIWIAFDSLADDGYQPSWDVLDSNLSAPISIGINNSTIADSLGLISCTQLSRDVRGLSSGTIVFNFFTLSDSVGGDHLSLHWDDSSFSYHQSGFFMQYVSVENLSGYIGAIDRDEVEISGYDEFTDSIRFFGDSAIVSFELPRCGNGPHVWEFLLKIGFNIVPTGIEENYPTKLELRPNPVEGFIHINADKAGSLRLFNMQGELLCQSQISSLESRRFDATVWPTGLYLAVFQDDSGAVITRRFLKR